MLGSTTRARRLALAAIAVAPGSGNDALSGGSNDDHLYGISGNDALTGGPGDDELSGASGNDLVRADSGIDQIDADWIILSEDDLEWCADPLGSMARWLEAHATPDVLVYRFLRQIYVKGSVTPIIVCGGVDSSVGERFGKDQIPLEIDKPDMKVGQRIWGALDYLI